VCIILKNSCDYYKSHPKECSFHNWTARLIAYLDFGKKVWPEPDEKEIAKLCEKEESRGVKRNKGRKATRKKA